MRSACSINVCFICLACAVIRAGVTPLHLERQVMWGVEGWREKRGKGSKESDARGGPGSGRRGNRQMLQTFV